MKKLIFISLLLAGCNSFYSQDPDSTYLKRYYNKAEYQIPMRDGIKLHTIVYSPKDQSVQYPILLNRTPYNVEPYGKEMAFNFYRGLSPVYPFSRG